LGNEEEISPFQLMISPNPSNDVFTIRTQQKPEKQKEILLYAIEGKEIIRKQLVNNELRL
jgi:hypothetical protein